MKGKGVSFMHLIMYVVTFMVCLALPIHISAARAEESNSSQQVTDKTADQALAQEEGAKPFRYEDYEYDNNAKQESHDFDGPKPTPIPQYIPEKDPNNPYESPFASQQQDEILGLQEKFEAMTPKEQRQALKGPLGNIYKQISQ